MDTQPRPARHNNTPQISRPSFIPCGADQGDQLTGPGVLHWVPRLGETSAGGGWLGAVCWGNEIGPQGSSWALDGMGEAAGGQ